MEAAAIFEDVFASVPIGEAEVEDFFFVKIADAAGAGAETMDEPMELVKFGGLEDFDAAGILGDPFAGKFCLDGRRIVGTVTGHAFAER